MKDIEKEYYNQENLWNVDFLDIRVERERIETIIKMIPENLKSVLDVGCGSGGVINSLPHAKRVGVDISREALKHVKTEKVLAAANNLPFGEKSFDMVICSEVLEHLEDDEFSDALQEIERVAKNYVLITVPNNENLKRSSVFCLSCQQMFHPYFHLRSFDKKKLANIFTRFKAIKIKESGPSRPFCPDFLVRVLRKVEKPKPLKTSICPFCGHKGQDIAENSSSGIFSLIKLKARVFFPKKKRWLFALYKCAE